jgi:hypothetical protein
MRKHWYNDPKKDEKDEIGKMQVDPRIFDDDYDDDDEGHVVGNECVRD